MNLDVSEFHQAISKAEIPVEYSKKIGKILLEMKESEPRISKDQIQALAKWARWVDAEGFCKVFGESLGMHLWNKMQQNHRGRFLEMWGFIDDECQAKFIEAINKGAN